MTFDGIDLEPDPWPAIILMAGVWCLPAVAFVIRRQLSDGARLKAPLAAAQWILVLGAALYSITSARLFDPSLNQLVQLAFVSVGPAIALAVVASIVLGLVRRQGPGGGVA